MSSITLTQMLEYYFKDGLSFTDLLRLYNAGKIALKDGIVSEDDLRAIVEEKDLPSLDKREFVPEETSIVDETDCANGEEEKFSKEQLEEMLSQCEKEIYSLEKQAKKKENFAEENLTAQYEKICDCYEQLSQMGPGNSTSAQAIRYRARLKELLESAAKPDDNKIADNLLKLGELLLDANSFKEALSLFREAKERYEGEIAKIRMADAREKSEYSAKLGVICYFTYVAENKAESTVNNVHRLDEAERLLKCHIQGDKTSKYNRILKIIRKTKEKCRK